jgi:hypothetical protein
VESRVVVHRLKISTATGFSDGIAADPKDAHLKKWRRPKGMNEWLSDQPSP